ncbi:vegetative cell wall protein gp1-like [Chrysoperla carnea]|uniref:vegetative cell wall protein gp1-like n=1 Tax=Chrysoperla carnea TaxID=189513 RepID=UPI001D08C35D|nr:vegetative cell wall protein gp1-like [Chrysoperla carnea]
MFLKLRFNIIFIGLLSFCEYVSSSKNLYLPPSNRFDAGYMPPINQNFLPELLQRPVYGPANFNPPRTHYVPPNYFPPPMYQIPNPSFHTYYPIDVPITTPPSEISITTSSPNNNPSTVSPPVGNLGYPGYPSYPSYFPGACWCGAYPNPQPSYAPPTSTVVPVATSTPQSVVSSPAPVSSSPAPVTVAPSIQPPVSSSPVDGAGLPSGEQTPAPMPPPPSVNP